MAYKVECLRFAEDSPRYKWTVYVDAKNFGNAEEKVRQWLEEINAHGTIQQITELDGKSVVIR